MDDVYSAKTNTLVKQNSRPRHNEPVGKLGGDNKYNMTYACCLKHVLCYGPLAMLRMGELRRELIIANKIGKCT